MSTRQHSRWHLAPTSDQFARPVGDAQVRLYHRSSRLSSGSIQVLRSAPVIRAILSGMFDVRPACMGVRSVRYMPLASVGRGFPVCARCTCVHVRWCALYVRARTPLGCARTHAPHRSAPPGGPRPSRLLLVFLVLVANSVRSRPAPVVKGFLDIFSGRLLCPSLYFRPLGRASAPDGPRRSRAARRLVGVAIRNL